MKTKKNKENNGYYTVLNRNIHIFNKAKTFITCTFLDEYLKPRFYISFFYSRKKLYYLLYVKIYVLHDSNITFIIDTSSTKNIKFVNTCNIIISTGQLKNPKYIF